MRADILWGVKWGAYFAGMATIFAPIILLLRWGRVDTGSISVVSVLLFYWVAGCSAGFIVGLLRPIAVSFLGQAVTGAIAAVPACFAAYSVIIPPVNWARDLVKVSLWSAVILGPLYAAAFRTVDDEDST